MIGYLKQALVILSASSGGFFMGSYLVLGYVAREALLAPTWYGYLKNYSVLALIACIGGVVCWLAVDLHDTGRIDLSKIGESQ